MGGLRVLVTKIRELFRRNRSETQFDEEVREHLQLLTACFVSRGMSEQDAAYAARRQFGNLDLLRQQQREGRTFHSFSNLWRDVAFAARMLGKNPLTTASVIVALAVGIGMNICVFTFINALLLRPPTDVRAPDRLREVWLHDRRGTGIFSYLPLNYPDYAYYRDRSHTFSAVLAFDGDPERVIWNRAGKGEMLQGQLVSGNFFSLLGINAAQGRTLDDQDDNPAHPQPVIVLGRAFWQQRLASDPNVIGKTMMLNGRPFSVIGVAPAGFTGLLAGIQPDFWAPLTAITWIARDADRLTNRQENWLLVVGRLAPGVHGDTAQAEMSVLAQAHPDINKDQQARLFPATLVPGPYRGYATAFTGLLMTVFALLLLIACTNAAGLFLVRATGRAREMAIRSSLGAGRGRLIRQLMTESVLMAAVAGAAGLALGWWTSTLLLKLKPASLPIALKPPVDWRVVLFTVVITLIAGVAFGIVPALRTSRVAPGSVLKEESQAGNRRKSRLRSVLLIGQIAVCMVLLIGATLCVRSLVHANSVDPGFDTEHVDVATLDPGGLGYSPARVDAFYRELLERVRAVPGVTMAGHIDHLPLGTAREQTFVLPAAHRGVEQNRLSVDRFQVGPGFFAAVGTSLLRGRDFTDNDVRESAHIAVVNEALAERLWPGSDPIGQRIIVAGEKTSTEVIGVVKTGKYRTLGEKPLPVIYGMDLPSRRVLVVRTSVEARSLLESIAQAVQSVDPGMAATDLQTISQYMALPLFPARTTGLLLGASGILALVLTSIGLFGVISWVVSQRTNEIGIRIAMGAGKRDVLRLVLKQALLITAIGEALGLGGAFAGTRALSSLLYGIRPNDPITLAGVSVALTAVALLASYIPARKAMRVDPAAALRYE